MRNALCALVFALMVACATSPETPSQRMAYAEAQVTAVAEHAADMRQRGELSDEELAEVVSLLERADRALDAGWNALENDDSPAGHLATVEEILTVAQEELDER